jgi:hypothetical protein
MNKKLGIIALLAIVVAVCGAAAAPSGTERVTTTPKQTVSGSAERAYKNLKVLPANISSKRLQQIMVDDFNEGLGVGCGFCHAEVKGSHRLDYASDAKPEKSIARAMMRMDMKINRKFFQVKHPMIGDSRLIVTCNSCHHGQAMPEGGNGE